MDINEYIKHANASEFAVRSLEENVLTVLGSDDLSYYHTVEIVYRDVRFMQIATSLWSPAFRDATSEDAAECAWRPDGDDARLFVVEDAFGGTTRRYFVAAASCEMTTGIVYHYQREPLEPGARIAAWVRK